MRSKRSQEGYILIDHRNSPGVREEDLTPAAKRAGFLPATGLFESPTIRCCHCGTMVVINPLRTRARHHCQRCDHYVCDQYACITTCTPFEQQVDDALEAAVHALTIKEV